MKDLDSESVKTLKKEIEEYTQRWKFISCLLIGGMNM